MQGIQKVLLSLLGQILTWGHLSKDWTWSKKLPQNQSDVLLLYIFWFFLLHLFSCCYQTVIYYAWIYKIEKNIRWKLGLRLVLFSIPSLFILNSTSDKGYHLLLVFFVRWLIRAMSLLPISGKAANPGEVLALPQSFV